MGIGGSIQEKLLAQLATAKRLDPAHDAAVQLELELLFYSGELEQAIKRCDEMIQKEEEKVAAAARTPKEEDADDESNAIPYILKANFLSQQAFAMMQERQNAAAVIEVRVIRALGSAVESRAMDRK